MNIILDALTNTANAEELGILVTALFTVLFQWAKKLLPEQALLPLSMAAGAGIGMLSVFFGEADTATVVSYITVALTNAAIPTGWFKAGQYIAKLRK